MIELVLIQRMPDEPSTWLARRGFRQKGYPTAFFDAEELSDIGITPTTLVFGGAATAHAALDRLNAVPRNIDYPDSLRAYLGRKVEATTFGEFQQRFYRASQPWFVKPLDIHKAFIGRVVSEYADLRPLFDMPDSLDVWVSEVVPFVSEWRYFVRRDRIVGCSHYEGDPKVQPNMATVRAAVQDYLRESPVAYGIDFGVTADGQTLLVEVNDAYCLGCMSLPSAEYTAMLQDRWVELMTGRVN